MPHWGMVIDQNRCIGCWTCAVGCKVINNEPDGVWWNRILTSTPNEEADLAGPASTSIDVPHGTFPVVGLAYLPLTCQHCDNPPCVKVCPVDATYRREDGSVVVDYERCIGCRYCMAACPYGVRVFNWRAGVHEPDFTVGFGQDHRSDGRLVFTPDRQVGVVEKCTLCVELIDDDQQPFCVDVCPTGARVFGDLSDSSSEASRLVNEQGARRLLEDLGTDPNVFYVPVRATGAVETI